MTRVNKYDSDLADLFAQSYRDALRLARNLEVSVKRTSGFFPLTAATFSRLDDEGLERLDAFIVRYAQLQDSLANKLFRSFLRLEEESAESMLDVLNAMEKRGIIIAFEEWKMLREIRNAFMHDYPGQSDVKAEALTRAHSMAPELLQVLKRVRKHAVSRIGLPADKVPEAFS